MLASSLPMVIVFSAVVTPMQTASEISSVSSATIAPGMG